MSGVTTPSGKPRRRDRWFKHLRSSSPATSSTINAQTSSGNSTSLQPISTTPIHPHSFTTATQLSVPVPCSLTASLSPAVQSLTLGLSASHHFLDTALQQLSDCDRETLQPFILSANGDVNEVLERSLAAAKKKQDECNAKRWTFTFDGRTVTLKDEADKIVRWLDRFKVVGDVAVNADPIHAGLPWAGVRFLLEVRPYILYGAHAI
jgi:hypothetical protein